ncbi:hypothetical protein IDAT_10490 [Pseudidiomarina atlantica]|uniref:Uncharacterized protein n=1 Tax=Pseudidiomarina atlantica TaxID=1517416 RepID=A0A094ILH0_9GAMM|nr:hypothetical protein IDAT_10490 [Pseudidiomarina atlantica]
MDTPVIFNDKDFLLWLSFAIFLGYLVFSRMRHKAPAKPLSDRVYLRFLARMFGGMMLGAFILFLIVTLMLLASAKFRR